MANCATYEEFFTQFGFLVEQLQRVMTPGRVVAVHAMDLPTHKTNGDEIGIRDFPGDIIRCFEKFGFIYHSRHCIWKDPLIAATRTKAIGLAHKQIVKDSALCRTAIPDYMLAFRKKGDNPKPIKHPKGLKVYHGARDVPHNLDRYITQDEGIETNPYEAKTDKRSHWIWQQYASPVWFDIRQTKVLPYKAGKEKDDQRHVAPLQLDCVYRCLELWSTKDDIVLTPFLGIGTEAFCAVKMGRRAIGIELKASYYRQAVRNVRMASHKSMEV